MPIFHCIFSLFLTCTLLSASLQSEQLKVDIEAEAAILINADTGAVLYEKRAHEPFFPASITKIATALYALQKKGNDLNVVITAEQESLAAITEEKKKKAEYKLPSYWLENDGSHIGIKVGEKLSFKDLLYGMMVASGNDAANVIAQYVGGNIPNFMQDLNAYLKSMGCKVTNFHNPHGLHHPNHISTAYEMALITREALKNPTFCELVKAVRYTRPKTNKQESTTLIQTNRLLRTGAYHYSKAIGVKTGSHSRAKYTFVGAARQDGRTLIVVLLKEKEPNTRFKDAIKLFDAAFKQPKMQKVLMKSGPQKYALKVPGGSKPASTYLKEDLKINYYPAEEPKVNAMVFWDKVTLPIAKGQKIGEVRVIDAGNNIVKAVPVYSQNEVKFSYLHKFISYFTTLSWVTWSILGAIFLAIFFFLKRR